MRTIRLIVECYGTCQVAETSWRDATSYRTVNVSVPDWLAESLAKLPKNSSARVVGAELTDEPTDTESGA